MFEKSKSAMELERIILSDKIDENELLGVLPQMSKLKECTQIHPAHCHGEILPENCYHVLKHTIKVVEGVPKDAFIRIVALLHDSGKPDTKKLGDDGFEHFWGHEEESAKIAKVLLKELGYRDEFINRVVTIIKYHDTKIELNIEAVRKMISLIGEDNFKQLIIHQKADLKAHSKEYHDRKIQNLNKIEQMYNQLDNQLTIDL